MLALLASAAFASDHASNWACSIGVGALANDPHAVQAGVQGGVSYSPRPVFSIGGHAGFYAQTGSKSGLARGDAGLIRHPGEVEDAATPSVRAGLVLQFVPIRAEGAAWTAEMGLFAGYGVIRTRDDLERMQAEDDPLALATEVQWIPASSTGTAVDVYSKKRQLGLRIRLDGVRYVEVFEGSRLELTTDRFVGLEVVGSR